MSQEIKEDTETSPNNIVGDIIGCIFIVIGFIVSLISGAGALWCSFTAITSKNDHASKMVSWGIACELIVFLVIGLALFFAGKVIRKPATKTLNNEAVSSNEK